MFLPHWVGKELLAVEELNTTGSRSDLTIIGLIDAKLDQPIAEAQQSITVELAGPAEAEHLRCTVGHPRLRIDRLYLNTDGQAVELATSHFLPERYCYRINLSRNRKQHTHTPTSRRPL